MDWIDKVKQERESGRKRALTQSQHNAVNDRYPGLTLEHCFRCGAATGRAGPAEDSIYCECCDPDGPWCEECYYDQHEPKDEPIYLCSECGHAGALSEGGWYWKGLVCGAHSPASPKPKRTP